MAEGEARPNLYSFYINSLLNVLCFLLRGPLPLLCINPGREPSVGDRSPALPPKVLSLPWLGCSPWLHTGLRVFLQLLFCEMGDMKPRTTDWQTGSRTSLMCVQRDLHRVADNISFMAGGERLSLGYTRVCTDTPPFCVLMQTMLRGC